MDNPELYHEVNNVTRLAATDLLNEYGPKLKGIKSEHRIIDVGCGDGAVTYILRKNVPTNCEKFIACDINENMLKFARDRYVKEKIIFRILNIEEEVPNDLKSGFDHVFSFFLLHWIQKQEAAFRSIYDLIHPGGECLLAFFEYNPITYLYYAIAQDHNMKWGSTWIKDIRKFVSVYCHMKNSEEYISGIMQNIGFININIQCKNRTYVFDNCVALKRLMRAVDPYGMPDDVFDEFFHDFMRVAKDNGIFINSLNDMNDEKKEIHFNYGLLVVDARKPV